MIAPTEIHVVGVCGATASDWDAAWKRCHHGTFFHSRAWAEAWQEVSEGRLVPDPRLVTFSDNKRAVICMSVRRSLRGLIRHGFSSVAGTYGGWLSGDDLGPIHAQLLSDLLTKRYARLDWRRNPFDGAAARAGVAAVDGDATQALELGGDFDAGFRRWSKGHRAAVRQAQREGVCVAVAETEADWRAYFAIYEKTLERWGDKATSRYGWELFDALRRRGEFVRLWLARTDAEPIAGALCLYAPKTVSYWHGAALEDWRRVRPAHLLMYAAIRDACERGLKWFDFNPSGGHEGVMAFKKSFGCLDLKAPLLRKRPLWKQWANRLKKKASSES